MSGFIDLHCHFVAGVDDGARSPEEGIEMLAALRQLGFDTVVATPHMRPGLFENTAETLTSAFARMQAHIQARDDLPRIELSSEHYFDEIVFERLMTQRGLPYPGGRAVLLEFYEMDFPPMIQQRLSELRYKGRVLPVIAHPERYRCIWQSTELLERLVEGGAAALLDTAALVGKYGRKPKRCAEKLLEAGLYHAACSDSHRVRDVEDVARGMRRIEKLYGREELEFLFAEGPRSLLSGRLPD